MSKKTRMLIGESGGHTLELESIGKNLYVRFDGVRIAKRGYPDTPQAKTWVPLEPGWRVLDGPNGHSIAIDHDGVRVQ